MRRSHPFLGTDAAEATCMRSLLLPLTLLALLTTASCATELGGDLPAPGPDCENCDDTGDSEAKQKLDDFAKRCDSAWFDERSQKVSIGPNPDNSYTRLMAECLGNFSLECIEDGGEDELEFFRDAPSLISFNGDMSRPGSYKTASGRTISFVACGDFEETGTCNGLWYRCAVCWVDGDMALGDSPSSLR
jgi:hypothetical protein